MTRLIDADALSKKLCETTIFIKDGEVFQRMINDAPTVQAEAVQGEWIITKEGEYDGRSVYKTVCSECGHETFYKANKAHFCPNCGARIQRR